MNKTDTPAKVASNDQLGPVCDTCNDTGQYAGDSQWYVCMDCDAALRGKVKQSTGPAQALHSQAVLDAAVAAERELDAWRERFPQYVFRPQDDCVALRA